MKNYKSVIFDRDGTLNRTSISKGGYVLSTSEIELLPYVKESLYKLKTKGIKLFVFTQQRCIGKGLITKNELEDINNQLNNLLGEGATIDKFYYCPHLVSDNCECSKPKAGMLFDCMRENNLNPDEVLVVGDSMRDYESAKNAGLDFIFVPNDLGKHSTAEYKASGAKIYDNLKLLVNANF